MPLDMDNTHTSSTLVARTFILDRQWLLVKQPLSNGRLDSGLRAFTILRMAVVVPELEFAQVAMQMNPTDVVVDAVNASLEKREEPFDRVAVDLPASIFTLAMTGRMVAAIVFSADPDVSAIVVREDSR